MKNKSGIENQGHQIAAGFFGHREIKAKERQGARTDIVAQMPQSDKGKAREKTDQEHNE